MTSERDYPDYYSGPERRRQALTQDDRQWIVDAIIKHHKCPFKDDEFAAIKKFLDITKTMGDGDMDKGVEKYREHSRFISSLLSKKSLVAGAAIVSIVGVTGAYWIKQMALFIQSLILTGGR